MNLIDRQVEVCTQPSGAGPRADYTSREVFQPGDSIPLLLENVATGLVAVNDLLP